MGRRENPLPRSDSPLVALAAHLRGLRIAAGTTYTDMAATVTAASSALAEAAAGRVLPRLDTVRDYVQACDGGDSDLARAEQLWRETARQIRGRSTSGKPDPAKVHTPQQFADAVDTLLEEAGLFGVRAIEDATTNVGSRIPRSTLSRWLRQNTHVMPNSMLNALLDACKVPARQRTTWTQARIRAALAAADLPTSTTTGSADGAPTGQDEEITSAPTPAQSDGVPQHAVVSGSSSIYQMGNDIRVPKSIRDITDAPIVLATAIDAVPDIGQPSSMGSSRTSLSSSTSLMNELRALCRGQGVQAPGIDKQVGPALREVCGITPSDGPDAVRAKIDRWVTGIVDQFPDDLRLAVLAPLGLHPEARSRFLSERVAWLTKLLDRGPRTVRRRIEVGLTRLVEAGLEPVVPPPAPLPSYEETGWHVSEFEALLRLDGPTPTCTERRTIRADRDGVEEIDWSITLPPATEDGLPGDLDVEVLHGVELISAERPAPRRFLLHLRLPRPLRTGQTHQFSLEVRIPKHQPMRPSYVFWPERACDRFRLVARFSPDTPPAALWRIDGAFHRDIDDLAEGSDLLTVNDIGEVEVSFPNPRLGRGYGIQWRPQAPDRPAPTAIQDQNRIRGGLMDPHYS